MAGSGCARAQVSSTIPGSISTPTAKSAWRNWSICSGISDWRGRRCCELAEYVLQHALAHNGDAIEFDRRAHHGQIEMARGIPSRNLVRAGGKQKVSRDGSQLSAIGVALIIHGQRLVTRAGIHAKTDMRHRVSFSVSPSGEIATHHRGVCAFTFEIDHIVVLQSHLDR